MNPVKIVLIVDRSGSMNSIWSDTIGGINSFVKSQKDAGEPAEISLIAFDDVDEKKWDNLSIDQAPVLQNDSFLPRGSTALLDAIGNAVTSLNAENPDRAVVAIVTDGGENASHKFTKAQVKELLQGAEAKGWAVAFLSADMDAVSEAATLGVNVKNLGKFAKSARGMSSAFANLSVSTMSYAAGGNYKTLDENAADGIQLVDDTNKPIAGSQ